MAEKNFDIKRLFKRIFSYPPIKTPLLAFAIVFSIGIVLLLFLHIFTRHGQGFPVPDFTGMSSKQVVAIANKKKLRFEISDSVYIRDKEPGSVIFQTPLPGVYVKPNRRVFLTINAINPQMVEMPNVVGVTLRQAKSILDLKGFVIGTLSFKQDIAINNILEQLYQGMEVEPGELLPKGSTINLVLGKGLYNEKTVLPRLIGLTLSDACNLLLEASLNIGKVAYDATVIDRIDSLTAKVYSQYPNPTGESSVNFGTKVNLWLTLNESRIPVEVIPEVVRKQPEIKQIEPEEEILE